MLQPFDVANATLERYRRYVRTSFPLSDPALEEQREQLIDDQGLLWAPPYVALSRPGTDGPSLASLADKLDERTLALPWGFDAIYAHQAAAIDRLRPTRPGGPASTLILSGTGSGKTESFLIPIVDACLRAPGPGIQAVLLYPMNALANDQLGRLRELLTDTEITFGRYTGDSPETDAGGDRQPPRPADAPENLLWSREAMRKNPPQILITNYLQLELLLLRGADRELFRFGVPRYLVVDEIHLFTGVLGAEVAALLRRFRQHVGLDPGELTFVGTSATAGVEELPRLVDFARRLFGVELSEEAAISEEAPPPPVPGPTVPPPSDIDQGLLTCAGDDDGLRELARATLGLELDPGLAGDELRIRLGEEIDNYATVAVVERALARPASLDTAAKALGALPERRGVSSDALGREAEALLLLGSAALQHSVGETEAAPRLRPRVHQVVRSIAGLARCLDTTCGRLLPAGRGRCDTCGSQALPLASCRNCGFAFWSGTVGRTGELEAVELEGGIGSFFLADPAALGAGIDEDEEGHGHRWEEVAVCSACGALATSSQPLHHGDDCPTPDAAGVLRRGSDDPRHCPSCGAMGTGARGVITPQRGSAAASVAVMTQILGDALRERTDEAGGRLLVFSDSRQNAGQQAGYADDQGARVAVRQLVLAALGAAPDGVSLPDLLLAVRGTVDGDDAQLRRWLVGQAGEELEERVRPEFIPSSEERDRLLRQLEWEVTLELTERARRRFSLEGQGVAAVGLDRLDELAAAVTESWSDYPFGTNKRLGETILAFLDAMRFYRAVDHQLLRLKPRALRVNHNIRIGDRAVTTTRGFSRRKHTQRSQEVDIRAWHSSRGATRMAELIGRIIGEAPTSERVAEVIDRLVQALQAVGLIVNRPVDARQRLMADHKRFVVRRTDGSLYRCPRCGHVRGTLLTSVRGEPLCITWRCLGRPVEFSPPEARDFYREQYARPPRRLVVREHSGQIQSDMRIALEQAFNDRERVPIDILACTPTLEVGVSLDDLNAIVLRNFPPSPVNYAQRVGRAGRRSKVALAFAHAGHGPHDAYFFERPGELIAGEVRAPAISLDNERLLGRHLNSLILETLRIDLPTQWMPPRTGGVEQDTVADEEGVVRESVIQRFADALSDVATQRRVREAAQGAFASSKDPGAPAGVEELCERQIERFPTALKAALERWCDRWRALDEELSALRQLRRPTDEERKMWNRLDSEMRQMEEAAAPDRRPLGFLGMVGFLPRYGATGERTLLVTPYTDAPIDQAAHVAVTDFAPGNIVYARGRRLKVTRVYPRPVEEVDGAAGFRDNMIREGRRCDECQLFTTDPLQHACPRCERDLVSQTVIELTGVRGGGGTISSDDEYRTRSSYDVMHALGTAGESAPSLHLGGYEVRLTRRQEITIANRGPLPKEPGMRSAGFSICKECGHAEEDPGLAVGEDREEPEAQEHRGHGPRCPARRDPNHAGVLRGAWLTARLQGDVLEIPLGRGQGDTGYQRWRRTLLEALMLGIRETMQADRRDLDAFEVPCDGVPERLVIFDTMPGGTGYLPKLMANEGQGLRAAAAEALERLESCDCDSSCHRCLRDFWNQRVHGLLDRRVVIPTLRRLAEAIGTEQLPDEDERLMSFLELEFHRRLEEAGLSMPTLQVIHRLPNGRITVADFAYADPDISIFLDGRAYHAQSEEKVRSDIRKRNDLEARGNLVLEFTYADVIDRFDKVTEMIRRGLAPSEPATSADEKVPEGLLVTSRDDATRTLEVTVKSAEWVAEEPVRQRDLEAANEARLEGWRLSRTAA